MQKATATAAPKRRRKKKNDLKRPTFSLLNPTKKILEIPNEAHFKRNSDAPWENIVLVPTSPKGSWIGSIYKVKQALSNNLLRTQCCWVFRLRPRPAGGDLRQISTSLPSSSNTPRQPKDSHLDATWNRTKVRRDIYVRLAYVYIL